MSVLSCSRRGCPHVMCNTYITGIGYICFDCQNEFKEFLDKNNKNPTTEEEIRDTLENFMETTPRKNYGCGGISIDEFFRQHTD